MDSFRHAGIRFPDMDRVRRRRSRVRLGGHPEKLRRTHGFLDLLRLCRDLRAHLDPDLMKKIDWNAVAFGILILVLVKNAAFNAASSSLLDVWK